MVLAGGLSTRFGSDKAEALFEGRALIDHAVALLAPHVEAVAVVGRDRAGLPRIDDRPAPGLGPLGGIAGALRHAAAAGYQAVLTVPCDTPLLDPALLATLAASQEPAMLRGLPVCGLWPVRLADALEARLASQEDRSIRGWADVIGARRLEAPPIPNVNTPADLEAIRRG